MRIYSLKRTTIPKIAVLATGLTAAILAATINPAPAQAEPSFGVTCTGCHTAGGSVTATPSSPTVAPGAAYTVAIVITNAASGNSGYNISLAGASVLVGAPAAGKTFSAAMTAPAAAGPYTYNVGADTGAPPGAASATTYSITVGASPTTVPPTTVPPTTTAPPTPLPTVSGEFNLSPTGTLGKSHLSMYSSYGTMSCAACHNGTAQPKAPAISIENANMKPGIACASCHGPGKREETLFISLMNDPAKTVYERCSSCHVIADGGEHGDDGGSWGGGSWGGGWGR